MTQAPAYLEMFGGCDDCKAMQILMPTAQGGTRTVVQHELACPAYGAKKAGGR